MKRFLMVPITFAVILATGLSGQAATPAQVVAGASTTQAASSCGDSYIVQEGDSLSSIAQQCNVLLSDLISANPNLGSPDLIYPTQTIAIPQNTAIPATGGTGNGSNTPSGTTYTVAEGDTLSGIASQYNTSVTALLNANPTLSSADSIITGQTITIPASTNTGNSIPNTGATGRNYTVATGDTLSGIAQQFNTTTTALLNANPQINNADLIYAGTVITIP